MPGGIRRADIEDADIVDAVELASTGLTDFVTGVAVTSTIAATKRIVFTDADIIHDKDYLIESGDFVILTGDAAGKYTVATIVDEHTLAVVEAIVDSVGGTAAFRYAPGAQQVGVDPTGLTQTVATEVQNVIRDLDAAISSGGMTEAGHRVVLQLIHFLDEGPGKGFVSGATKTVTGTVFPTQELWRRQDGTKLLEKNVTWTGVNPTTIEWKMYAADGVTVLETVTDTITYSGIFETSRTRTIA